MIESYKKLRENYEKLDSAYSQEVAEKLDLQLKYDNLRAEYNNDKSQREEIERLHENTRRLKHDMRNHIMVIASYLNNNEVENAKEYLSVMLDNLNKVYSYVNTGNSVMNYIINSKLEYAHEKGIEVKAEIENLSFKKIGSVDFSSLLGNTLDNAIEASLNIKEPFVYVGILKKRGYDTILIKNRIEKSVLETNPELNTVKGNFQSHGYGVKQIKEITEKYDGIIDIYEENNMFCVNILFDASS